MYDAILAPDGYYGKRYLVEGPDYASLHRTTAGRATRIKELMTMCSAETIRAARAAVDNDGVEEPARPGPQRATRARQDASAQAITPSFVGTGSHGEAAVIWAHASPRVRVALRLGRIIFSNLTMNIPDTAYVTRCLQYTLEEADIGHKFHGREVVPALASCGSALCEGAVRKDFEAAVPNLGMPSAFQVIWDGVTLENGATVLPILVNFTNALGYIQTGFLDAPSHGKSHTAVATSAVVSSTLQRHLSPASAVATLATSPMPASTRARLVAMPRWKLWLSGSVDGRELAAVNALNAAVGGKAIAQWDWLHRGNACGQRTLKRKLAGGESASSTSTTNSSSQPRRGRRRKRRAGARKPLKHARLNA